MARRKIIAGNWKMNMTPTQAVELVNTLKPLVVTDEADVVFCVPAIDIIPVAEAVKEAILKLAQRTCILKRAAHIQARSLRPCLWMQA